MKLRFLANIIQNSKCEKLLGIKIHGKLCFKTRVKDLCTSQNYTVHGFSKKNIVLNAFFKSQFSYYLLAWMRHSHRLNQKINTLHERCLRIVHYEKQSTFQKLLDKIKSVLIHNPDLKTIPTVMFQVTRGLSSDIFSTVFDTKNKVN